MKKLLAFLMMLVLLVPLTACKSDQGPYIEPAQLNEDEKAIAGLLGLNTEQRIYDFVLDDTVKSMEFSVYELKDGAWEPVSDGARIFEDEKGRIAVGFDKIAEGFRFAVQSKSHGGADTYVSGEECDFAGMAVHTSAMADRTQIVYDEEIPLAVQIITSKNEVRSYGPEGFNTPEIYAESGYEYVYAITIRFSQKTVEETEQAE